SKDTNFLNGFGVRV
nr:nsp11 [Human coronavirus OC43]YP_009944264.1 nsp11 [Rabbit coronavirus HKU14]